MVSLLKGMEKRNENVAITMIHVCIHHFVWLVVVSIYPFLVKLQQFSKILLMLRNIILTMFEGCLLFSVAFTLKSMENVWMSANIHNRCDSNKEKILPTLRIYLYFFTSFLHYLFYTFFFSFSSTEVIYWNHSVTKKSTFFHS